MAETNNPLLRNTNMKKIIVISVLFVGGCLTPQREQAIKVGALGVHGLADNCRTTMNFNECLKGLELSEALHNEMLIWVGEDPNTFYGD